MRLHILRIWTKQGQNVAKYDTSNQIQPLILPLEEFIALCFPHVPEIPTYLFINDDNSYVRTKPIFWPKLTTVQQL